MAVSGHLHTMTLPDLLQWAKVNRKSGALILERVGVRRGAAFRNGTIVGCMTNDASLIGHCLLSSSKITPEMLDELLRKRETTGQSLSQIVVDQGVVSREELVAQLTAWAEETLYSLFDWPDARFEFADSVELDESWTEVEIDTDAILLNGSQRLDEIKMIRSAFPGSGIVFELTDEPAPEQIVHSGMARRILGSIDGKLTLAQVLERAQASEFLVLKFLYHLFRKNVVVIREQRPAAPGAATLVDDVVVEELRPAAPSPAEAPVQVPPQTGIADLSTGLTTPQETVLLDRVPGEEAPDGSDGQLSEFESLVEVAKMLSVEGDAPEEEVPASLAAAAADLMAAAQVGFATEPPIDVPYAVDVSDASDRTAGPAAEAEPALEPASPPADEPIEVAPTDPETVPTAVAPDLSPERVPVMLRDVGTLIDENLSAEACMLVQLICTQMDIKTILFTAPFSEEMVLDELRDLAERKIIEILGPQQIEDAAGVLGALTGVDPAP